MYSAFGKSVRRYCAAMGAVLLMPLAALADGPATFARSDYKVGNKPGKLLSADLNHDGIADIAVLNYSDMSVLYGQGAGVFAKAKTLGTGYSPKNIISADLNKDGRSDLAVINQGGIRIVCGTSAGKLARKAPLPLKYSWFGLASADFDKDGNLDLAAGQIVFWGGRWGVDHSAYSALVLTGTGDGKFPTKKRYPVAKAPSAIATGDLNADGFADIVVSTLASAGGINVFYGQEGGSFAERVEYPSPAADDMVVADLNGDGRLDVALVGTVVDEVAVLYGRDGGFEQPVIYAVADVHGSIATGDFNGDGLADIATVRGTTEGLVTILYGQEGGGFGQAADYAVGPHPAGVAAADLNGDGLLDMAVTSGASRTVSVLLNTGILP